MLVDKFRYHLVGNTSVLQATKAASKSRCGLVCQLGGTTEIYTKRVDPSIKRRRIDAVTAPKLRSGYAAYEVYAKRHGLSHAQCWSHCRRNFERAQESEPEAVAAVLALIGSLYAHEKTNDHEGAAAGLYAERMTLSMPQKAGCSITG